MNDAHVVGRLLLDEPPTTSALVVLVIGVVVPFLALRPRVPIALVFFAHCGWLFQREVSNRACFAPDHIADPDTRRVDSLFPTLALASIFGPLVRIGLLHHVTWSINSICHVYGARPFATNDRATNFWSLAIISMDESWHCSHHADPTCARHGRHARTARPVSPCHLGL